MNKTGFGFLRLPLLDPADPLSIDYTLLCKMVDRFLELGGHYFDTAYTYEGSENALRKTLVERHSRDAFMIADKLPGYNIKNYEECQVLFDEQLERCGVDYFDVYMLHWLNEENYQIAEATQQFRFLQHLKQAGLAKAIGFSYHDGPQLLDRILTAHPEVDYVQLQINYLDWESPAIQAKECYDVVVKHNKHLVVMEPVKGGSLVNLPADAQSLLKNIQPQLSNAAWAIRFVTDCPQVDVVLSGMNAMAQIEDNMQTFRNLTSDEHDILREVAQIIRKKTAIGCTACRYCIPHCPQSIPIPRYFSIYNDYARDPDDAWKMRHAYNRLKNDFVSAADCIACGSCEAHCPQKLPIIETLQKVVQALT